ncbi:spore germination protein GerPC [Neobacillus sp. D3-1R]|uniref:spore germination protein GerPC n=1 Tax=Neobacillus sp. D3-1R TaxID=3445778 RepID=UPI003F9FF8EA
MNDQFYDYIRQLHSVVESQGKKLKQLEKTVQTLEEELKGIKNKTPINVERIEYKFDQLKIETLEGTLNIGLNPTDLEKGIEDEFSVSGQQLAPNPVGPAARMQYTMKIEESILHYLENETKTIMDQYAQEKRIQLDDSYVSFVQNDVKKQLSNRIEFYVNQIPSAQRTPEHLAQAEQQIVKLIKNDIQKGIKVFLDNLPAEVKGGTDS